MMYITIYESIRRSWIPELSHFQLQFYMSKAWQDFQIVNVSSTFKAPLLSNDFSGVLRVTKITPSSRHLWFNMDLTARPNDEFEPQPGVLTHARSEMTLAIKDYKNVELKF